MGPSVKVTEPVGVPPLEVTVALKVTLESVVAGFKLDVNAVAVLLSVVPFRATFCGELVALLLDMLRVAVLLPTWLGV